MTFRDFPLTLPTLALSYGVESLLAERAMEAGLTPEDVAKCLFEVYPAKAVNSGLTEFLERLGRRIQRLGKRQAQVAAAEAQPSPPRSFGAVLTEWSQGLSPSGLCLFLADYDPLKAHHLFWKVEADLLDMALQEKLGRVAQQFNSQYEATLYAFGGKYADDPSAGDNGDTTVHDLHTEEGMAALKAFGMFG